MFQKRRLLVLLQEYHRAATDYFTLIETLSKEAFLQIRDTSTSDPDCQSIQTVATHLVRSAYTYANYINTAIGGEWLEYKQKIQTPEVAVLELKAALVYTETALQKVDTKTNTEIDNWKFHTRWNVTYDFEQLMEHAICHILRHRRQIEFFIEMEG